MCWHWVDPGVGVYTCRRQWHDGFDICRSLRAHACQSSHTAPRKDHCWWYLFPCFSVGSMMSSWYLQMLTIYIVAASPPSSDFLGSKLLRWLTQISSVSRSASILLDLSSRSAFKPVFDIATSKPSLAHHLVDRRTGPWNYCRLARYTPPTPS